MEKDKLGNVIGAVQNILPFLKGLELAVGIEEAQELLVDALVEKQEKAVTLSGRYLLRYAVIQHNAPCQVSGLIGIHVKNLLVGRIQDEGANYISVFINSEIANQLPYCFEETLEMSIANPLLVREKDNHFFTLRGF